MNAKFADILAADRVAAGVTVADKAEALRQMAALLHKGCPGHELSEIEKCLFAREKLGSTGLGHGVAIPHGRLRGLEQPVGAFLQLARPVDFDAHDGEPVDLLFGLLMPPAANEEHLRVLAAIAEMFGSEQRCEALRAAADAESLLQAITGG